LLDCPAVSLFGPRMGIDDHVTTRMGIDDHVTTKRLTDKLFTTTNRQFHLYTDTSDKEGLSELEYLKTKTRLKDERFEIVMGECVI
jgi:hypothetical protein